MARKDMPGLRRPGAVVHLPFPTSMQHHSSNHDQDHQIVADKLHRRQKLEFASDACRRTRNAKSGDHPHLSDAFGRTVLSADQHMSADKCNIVPQDTFSGSRYLSSTNLNS